MATAVDHIAGVGIIFREKDPRQIFIEIKDDGLPIKAFRRGLCPIGGNWIGTAARNDANTFDTFRREFDEEVSLERATASTLELRLLGDEPDGNFYQTPRTNTIINPGDSEKLQTIKRIVLASEYRPFGDFITDIPRDVIDRADPGNKRDGFNVLVSYFLIPLAEDAWQLLTELQGSFGNLSNESITVITSLDEITKFGIKSSYGHDQPLKEFFLSQGYTVAHKFPIVPGITCQEIGNPMSSYEEYLSKYDIKRVP